MYHCWFRDKNRMKKGFTGGYIITFLLGAGVTALATYIYVTMTAVPPATNPDLPKESAGTAEEEGRKSEVRTIPRERPGDKSRLPADTPKKDNEGISSVKNPAQILSGGRPSGTEPAAPAVAKNDRESASEGTGKDFSVFLRQDDVNRLLELHLSGKGENGLLPAGAVKNARLAINGKELGLYANLNLDEIAKATATEEDRQKLETIKKYLPFVDTNNLDVEIRGDFSVHKGMLMIDPDAQVKIASLNMRLSTLHGLLLSGNPLPAEVPLQSVQGVQIEELTVGNNGIQVAGKQASN